MDTRRTRITVHGVPVDISGDRLGAFFAQYGLVEEVIKTISKAGIATEDFVWQVTLRRKRFVEIPNVLICRDKMIPVVV